MIKSDYKILKQIANNNSNIENDSISHEKYVELYSKGYILRDKQATNSMNLPEGYCCVKLTAKAKEEMEKYNTEHSKGLIAKIALIFSALSLLIDFFQLL